jgi:hypothetical protein
VSSLPVDIVVGAGGVGGELIVVLLVCSWTVCDPRLSSCCTLHCCCTGASICNMCSLLITQRRVCGSTDSGISTCRLNSRLTDLSESVQPCRMSALFFIHAFDNDGQCSERATVQ